MTENLSESNKRIAKNTLFLYVRMGLSILVNLYTVRVIWQVLGIDDYGIYTLVGGIVLMFQFLNGAMTATSQRYISFELGRGRDSERLHRVFSVSVSVHYVLAFIILVLAETAGLWFVNSQLNIPPHRMAAANWVYQCSVLAFLVSVVSVPYNACIVAHERMKAYGYMGILEVVLKLVIVFLLLFIPYDKLIVYALLVLAVQCLVRVLYQVYCRRNFAECRYRYRRDRRLMRDMFSFAGWSFLGNMGFSVRDQGLNILLNIFFNVAMNAAKGVATNISNVVMGFTANFQMALNPQITKRYASGDTPSMLELVFRGCKYSFLLLMVIVVPLWVACREVLCLWLDDVNTWMVGFLRLVFITALIDSMASPIVTALQATGRIKRFQIIISVIMVANIPLAWVWLKCHADPYAVVYVTIITSAVGLAGRLALLRELVPFDLWGEMLRLARQLLPAFAVSGCCAWFLYPLFGQNVLALAAFGLVSLAVSAAAIYLLSLGRGEKDMVRRLACERLHIKV